MIFKSLSALYQRSILVLNENEKRWNISPFWFGFYFVLIVGLIVYLVLPLFLPHLFNEGILIFFPDPQFYHQLALQTAQLPWLDFSFLPEKQFPAGILAFLYKVTGISKPVIVLPILGLLAGLTIRGIASCLDALGVRGRWWPILIGVLFTVTPTSLSWMIYPFKDAFIVPGVILIAWAFIAVSLKRALARHFISLIIGSIVVFSNKSNLAELFFLGAFFAFLLTFKKREGKKSRLSFFALSLIIFGSLGYLNIGLIDVSTYQNSNRWKSIPGGDIVNKPLMALAASRDKFLIDKSYGSTNFLTDVHLEGGLDTILFLPRALQLVLLEPFPWRESAREGTRGILFTLVQLEMLLVYASLFFLLFVGKKNWTTAVLVCLVLSLPVLVALGVAYPNIGIINRYRFPFLILIKMAGLAALWNSSRFKWPGRLLMWVDPPEIAREKKKVLFLVPDDVTFIIQRLVMAQGVQKAGYDVHIAAEDTGVSDKIRELGFTFHRLDLNRGGLNPFADFKPFLKLVFFLSKQRPDILQCVSIKPVLYGATAGTIVGLKRIVCLVNGLGYAFEGNNFKGKIVKRIAMALYRNALALPGIRVIFQNPDDRAYFIDNELVAANKTLLIRGSGVNMEKFKTTPQPNNPRPVILFVGRLLWNKGIKELVEASRILKLEKLEFNLKIVGGPDDRNPEAVPEAYLKSLHEEGIIEWVGRQSDMPKFYREADIVCLPTQYKEGLPLTLLEAASTGRTLVATDVPGCREIVRNGVNGYLVPPKSISELADALRILIKSSELRKKYGEKSAQIVKEEFSAEIIQMQLVSTYESLLNDSSPRADNLVHV